MAEALVCARQRPPQFPLRPYSPPQFPLHPYTEPHLSADLLDRRPGLSLPQRHRNLLLREPALPNRPVLPAPASGIKTDRILRPLREFLWTC